MKYYQNDRYILRTAVDCNTLEIQIFRICVIGWTLSIARDFLELFYLFKQSFFEGLAIVGRRESTL